MGSPTSDGSFFSEIGLGAAQQTNWQNLVTEAQTANAAAQAAITTVNASVATASAAATGASASAATASGAATTATTQAANASTSATAAAGSATTAGTAATTATTQATAAAGSATTASTAATTATGAATTATTQATNASASATTASTAATTATNAAAQIANPNKLINGFMEIDQANEGAGVTTSTKYIADGFLMQYNASGATVTGGRTTAPAPTGYPNAVYLQNNTPGTSSSTSYAFIQQTVEADNLTDLLLGTANARQMSLSFWAYCTVAGAYSVSLRNATNNISCVNNFTLVANTWTFFTFVIPACTIGTWVTSGNAAGLVLTWAAFSGSTYSAPSTNVWSSGNYLGTSSNTTGWSTTSSATFYLGPCKLEIGSTPTALVKLTQAEELAKCQRYYEKSYDMGVVIGTASASGSSALTVNGLSVNSQAGSSVSYKEVKRTDPTLTVYSLHTGTTAKVYDVNASADVTANITGAAGQRQFTWFATPASGGPVNFAFHWTADARL